MLVATVGLTETAGSQIVGHFDKLSATEVTAEVADNNVLVSNQHNYFLPWDSESRISRLNGVEAVGTLTLINIGGAVTTSVPVTDPAAATEFSIEVVAASPGLFDAVNTSLKFGRFFDVGHDKMGDKVAILGPVAAQRLNIGRVDNQPVIFVGEERFAVIGVIADFGVERHVELLSQIIIPNGTARQVYGIEAPSLVYIRTEIGAANLLAQQAPVALSPNDPNLVSITVSSDLTGLKDKVRSDINMLFILLGIITLIIGGIGIADVTLASVLERRAEIGLRRAVGATRIQIAHQFLIESMVLGAHGGLMGTSFGLIIISVVSAIRGWDAVLQTWLPILAPMSGVIIGLAAGIYPSLKAARIQPIQALRGL